MTRARLLVLSLLAAALATYADDAEKEARAHHEAGLSAMADRDWETARRHFAQAITEAPKADFAEESSFLSAKALDFARNDAKAVEAYKQFLAEYPSSRFTTRARFLVADVYTRMKRFDEAAEVLRAEALALAGEERRQALAKFYVDLANEFYAPPDPARPFPRLIGEPQPPQDFGRALQYFAKAQEILGPTPELLASQTWCRLRLQDWDGADQLARDLVSRFPKHALRGDAFYYVGYVAYVKGEAAKARELLSILPDEYGDNPLCPAAQFLFGVTYAPTETGDEDAFKKGLAAWEEYLAKYPAHAFAPEVHMRIAQAYTHWADQTSAIAALERFLARFPQDARAPEAQFAIGQAYLELDRYDEATQAFQKYLTTWPNDPRWQQAQGLVVEAAWQKGMNQFVEEEYDAAIETWHAFLRQFPLSEHCAEAQFHIGEIASRREAHDLAIAEWEKCRSKYGQSEWAANAAIQIAWHREHVLAKTEEDVEKVVTLYREVLQQYPGSSAASEAADNLREMLLKALGIKVARAYATNEKPLLSVHTRNVKKLSYRAYKIDLEEYFRKKQSLGGVEQIAVEIVKPDLTWEEDVPGYLPYRLIDREVEIPLEGPGAWVLTVTTVSDGASAGEYTATVLLVRSDLSIVTKSTPSQVLVFARNEATGRPWPGARVLVSDGTGVKHELTTGPDGTVLQAWDATWGEIRVLVTDGQHIANSLGTLNAGVTWGYQTKGYVYTDRPAYRPNQTVNWKAILRKVGGGYYTTTAGEKVKVEVRAPNGLVLDERELATNELGTVTGVVALGDEPALGTYQIKATLAEKDFIGTFQVLEYKKPEMVVDITADKECVLAGDEVKATVQVNYAFGGPVRNAEVAYQVLAGPYAFDRARYEEFGWFAALVSARERETTREGEFMTEGHTTTDANGVAEVRFRTRGGVDATYTVVAAVQDASRQWVTGAANVPATLVDGFAVVRTARRLYQPRERVTVNVLTVNSLHTPIAREGKVVIARVREVDGHEVTEPVSDYDTQTDAQGKAEVQIAVDRPGEYVVQFVSGKVEGGTPIEVAGEAEDLAKRAKVVSDRLAYMRDDTAKVLINSPVAPVTALLTFEAERVLEYRVVELTERSTTMEVPMKDLYAPNVHIAIAIPAEHTLFEDAQEVLVFKYLTVKVEPATAALKPREEATFVVRTTDQNGKPVSGEFSFALVDDTIYQIASENAPNLLAHFYDQRRPRAVTTDSSYEFAYDGVVAEVAGDLQSEEKRKELEKKLEENLALLAEEAQLKSPPKPAPPGSPNWDAPANDPGQAATGAAFSPEEGETDHNESADSEDYLEAKGKSDDVSKSRGESGGKDGGFRGKAGEDLRRNRRQELQKAVMGGYLDMDEVYASYDKLPSRRYAEWVAPELRKQFADTAFWAGALVTDENGLATVRVTLPDNLTTWRATVRAVTVDTLVGSGTARVESKKDVVARVAAPRYLTQNDEATIVGTVNNALTSEQRVKYVFRVEGVETETLPAQERAVPAGEVLAIDHAVRAVAPGHVLFHVEGLTTVESDAVEIGIETLPHGVREVEGASGTVEDRAMAEFVLPESIVSGSTRVELRLAPSVDASILDALIYLEEYPYGCIEQTLNRFAPGIAALRALRQLGVPNEALAKRLDGIVQTGLLRVNQLQNPDGGWGWWAGNASDPFTTAYTLVCLEEVRKAGYAVNGTVREKAVIASKQLLANAGTDYDTRAYLLYALSYSEETDVEDLMRCYRQREALSDYGAAVLALALKALHRDPNAAQVAEMISSRAKADGAYSHWGAREDRYGWLDEGVEATSYALLALLAVNPTDTAIERAAQWLFDRRPAGTHWGSTKATAAAIRALSAYVQAKGVTSADYELSVTLNEQAVGKWSVVHGQLPEEARRIFLPLASLRPGRNVVRLEKAGSGKLLYTLRAEYFRAGEDVQPVGNLIGVARRYEAWTRPGTEQQPTMGGYDVVRPERRPKFEDVGLREVATADRIQVRLSIESRQELSYVIVEDPLPAGCEVLEEGMSGAFDHQERRDEKMAFFFTKLPAGKTEVTYLIQAVFPGRYHVMPTWASPMYRPEVFGRGPEHRLAILTAADAAAKRGPSAEELPDETYAIGKKAWKEGRTEDAKAAFQKLLDRGDLRDEIAEELLGVMLSIALGEKDHRGAIRSYEELMDRNPNTAVRLSDLREIAVAYDEQGEDERAIGLYDRVFAGAYQVERGAVGSQWELGRFPDAQARWEKLLGAYPERNWNVDETWQLLRTRVEAAQRGGLEERKRALTDLRSFLAWYPSSGLSDDVDWTLIQLIQQVGTVKGGIAQGAAEGLAGEAERFLARYPDSPYADEAEHARMAGEFALGRFDRALAAGEALLTKLYPDDAGNRRESPYRDAAHYLMGKAYHVQGDLAKAVEHYTQSSVGDARDSLSFLTSKGLALPETTYFGEKDPLSLAVSAKNLPEATLKVYKVDLMVLLASRKDLGNVARIDLTGIAPLSEWKVQLGENRYRLCDQRVDVPVEGKGAFLVVAKGEELDASSVLIRTEIALRVQKVENRVRVYVTDREGQAPVRDAYVKVSDGTRVVASGYTDARGVFEAGLLGAPGLLSIVAERGDDVALIRE